MTDHQSALSDALAELSAQQGSAWTFGASTFNGTESDLRPSDPRLVGAPDRLIEIRVKTSLLPFVYPKRGNEITRGGETHTVHRVDHNYTAGISIFLVHRSSLPSRWIPVVLPDFSGADFSPTDFSTAKGSDFSATDFSSTDFKT